MTRYGLVWSFVAALALATVAAPAQAQTKSELAAARNLFQEAVTDEQAKRFDVALEKFRQVQAVRDTTHVRYRIAACLEALGKLGESSASYEAAIQLGEADAKSSDVVRSAKERIAELKKRMPALTITLSEKAPPDAEVEVDHEKIPSSALGAPLALDPGVHDVSGSATNVPPFHTSLTLAEGARVSLVVPLDRPAVAAVTPAPMLVERPTPADPDKHPMPSSTDGGRRTWGFVALGTGGALLVTSGVVLLLRHNDIATLDDACHNGGVCPRSREAELTRVRSRAVTEGPVAGVLAAGGLVAAGIGVWLLASGPDAKATSARQRPVVGAFATPSAGGVDLAGTF
jgi:hypothetical protein